MVKNMNNDWAINGAIMPYDYIIQLVEEELERSKQLLARYEYNKYINRHYDAVLHQLHDLKFLCSDEGYTRLKNAIVNIANRLAGTRKKVFYIAPRGYMKTRSRLHYGFALRCELDKKRKIIYTDWTYIAYEGYNVYNLF